jgi:hypothetical protein
VNSKYDKDANIASFEPNLSVVFCVSCVHPGYTDINGNYTVITGAS